MLIILMSDHGEELLDHKGWPHEEHPLIDVGVTELNKNPENYFAQVEQSAFNPANVVPGIGFSPDKSCRDASSPPLTPSAIHGRPPERLSRGRAAPRGW